eukprot:scaffold1236_cov170-Ochromonas_danica.AAC.5
MGGSASAVSISSYFLGSGNEAALAKVLMPLYFTTEAITDSEKTAAKKTFNLILGNQCEAFNRYKAEHPSTPCKTAMQFMHALFFQRLFHMHPACKPLFSHGTHKMDILPILTMFFSLIDQPDRLKSGLKHFIDVHCRLGVKAIECERAFLSLSPCYCCLLSHSCCLILAALLCFALLAVGLAGECAMHAIRATVGPEIYTEEASRGWCKIFSTLLAIIIPAAMAYELDNGTKAAIQAQERYRMMNESINVCTTCVRLQAIADGSNDKLCDVSNSFIWRTSSQPNSAARQYDTQVSRSFSGHEATPSERGILLNPSTSHTAASLSEPATPLPPSGNPRLLHDCPVVSEGSEHIRASEPTNGAIASVDKNSSNEPGVEPGTSADPAPSSSSTS